MKTLLSFCILMVLASAQARAGMVFALDNPFQVGHTGDTLHFFGTISNNGVDPIYLAGHAILFTPSFAVTDLFNANVPPSLAPLTSTGSIDLFDVSLDFLGPGLYVGTYVLDQGGPPLPPPSPVAEPFDIIISPPAPTPEPATAAMLAIALGGLLAWRRSVRTRSRGTDCRLRGDAALPAA